MTDDLAEAVEREFGPIGWQDIRLVAGEGKLSLNATMAAVNAILNRRADRLRLLLAEVGPITEDQRQAGWVLVPREPTEAMLHEGATDDTPRTATNTLDRMYETVANIYRAMISAAPAPPITEGT